MIRLTVLYGHPSDPGAFLDYYESTHVPLAERIPELTNMTWGKCLATPTGEDPPYFLTAELTWDSAESMATAMASSEGQAASADVANFATGGVTMVVSEGHGFKG